MSCGSRLFTIMDILSSGRTRISFAWTAAKVPSVCWRSWKYTTSLGVAQELRSAAQAASSRQRFRIFCLFICLGLFVHQTYTSRMKSASISTVAASIEGISTSRRLTLEPLTVTRLPSQPSSLPPTIRILLLHISGVISSGR